MGYSLIYLNRNEWDGNFECSSSTFYPWLEGL